MKVWGQKHLFWNKKVVKNGTGKMKIKQTTSKKVQAFVSQLLSFVFLGVSVSSTVVLINSHETVTSNKSIALIWQVWNVQGNLLCTGKKEERKWYDDFLQSQRIESILKFLGCNGKRRSRNFIWFFWLSKTNFRLVGAQTSVINKEVCPWETLWSQFY